MAVIGVTTYSSRTGRSGIFQIDASECKWSATFDGNLFGVTFDVQQSTKIISKSKEVTIEKSRECRVYFYVVNGKVTISGENGTAIINIFAE